MAQTFSLVAASGGQLKTWPLLGDVPGAPFAGPVSAPSGEHMAFSRNGVWVAVPVGSTVEVYAWAADHVGALVDTQSYPGAVRGVAWSAAGDAIFAAFEAAPFVQAHHWTAAGFQAAYPDPATPPTGLARAIAVNPAGNVVAVAHATSPFVSTYPWDVTTGFGAKYANPATLPGANAVDVAFRRTGHLAVLWNGSPGFAVYPFTAAGFGLKLADPPNWVAQAGENLDWSPDGLLLAVSDGGVSGDVHFYRLQGSTLLGVVTLFIGGDSKQVRFSPSGRFVAINLIGSPYLLVYRVVLFAGDSLPLGELVGVGALAGPIVWGPMGSTPTGTAGGHAIRATQVLYDPATPSDWLPFLPTQVQAALDLLAERAATAEAMLAYIIAQTGIVPPAEVAMPFQQDMESGPTPDAPSDMMQPTPQ